MEPEDKKRQLEKLIPHLTRLFLVLGIFSAVFFIAYYVIHAYKYLQTYL